MSRPLISVIVPVYNAERYLRRCVESIINQTYQNLEIMLVDDGSVDSSGTICDEYTSKDDRVQSIHLKNSGVSVARNYGIEHTKGEYIVFVDSDDLLHDQMIEKLYTAVCDGADMAVCSCRYIVDNREEEISEDTNEYMVVERNELLDDLYYLKRPLKNVEMTAAWGKIYLRSVVENIRFDPLLSVGEDFVFNFYYANKVKRAVILAYSGYDYRQNGNGVMNTAFDGKKRQTFERIKTLAQAEQDNIGFVTRMVNIAIVLLIMIRDANEDACFNEITGFIKQYRRRILADPTTRLKVRASLAISYGGFENMVKIYRGVECLTHLKHSK